MSNQERKCCAARRTTSNNPSKVNRPKMPEKEASKKNMVHLPGGEFLMGTDSPVAFPQDGEGPVRKVTVNPFYMDQYAVTNAEFAEFIKATNYQTEAESFGWSFVFHLLLSAETAKKVTQHVAATPWWAVVEGAYWKQPEGPDSTIEDRMDHPVVHISWNDAVAYSNWKGKRLPTEAEWEFAARGGLEQQEYPWGNELTPDGEHRCNIWQGTFPNENTKADGYLGTAPARTYEPNGYELYQMAGNVWEWCADWFTNIDKDKGGRKNPLGPSSGQAKLIRGGSFLCHKSYCNRYRVAARSANTPDSSTSNMGFRCVVDG